MRLRLFLYTFVIVIGLNCYAVNSQLPPRLNIPGAVLLTQPKPIRQQRIQQGDIGIPPQRFRRPIQHAPPVSIRPVVEEAEEPLPTPTSNSFDDEVAKLGISVLQNAVREAVNEEEEPIQRPVAFRPERPVPVLRENIRDTPISRPLPVLRQDQRETIARPIARQEFRDDIQSASPPRPQVRVVRPQAPPQQPQAQQFRQPARVSPPPQRPPSQYVDEEDRHSRTRKPVVQILRKYRTDNADGSITWGFENEDGTFKEETLGIDCVTKGKYGYIDPDGVRREYSYETGNKCDQREQEEEEESFAGRPLTQPQPRKPQPQFRPAPAQY